ncbi:MAG TPA: hypothetical protein VE640_09195 [Candidatus Bathyarchaeia archaeon]|jgi:hypothetical protein|nr:hypothetical protein [Candidatus Bathyarchaeia archaeon]
MRHGPRRRQAAATIYVAFGLLVLAMAIVTSSPVLLVFAALSILTSVLALTRFPVDRGR